LTFLLYISIICDFNFISSNNGTDNVSKISFFSFISHLAMELWSWKLNFRFDILWWKFVRITSGFGGGEFTKTLRKVCTRQKLKFAFLLLEYCKIRECYAVANAFTIRNMYCLLLYMKCNARNSPPPKPEVILTNFFAEPTVLLVPITSRDNARQFLRCYYHSSVSIHLFIHLKFSVSLILQNIWILPTSADNGLE
jgi:hypothetical protein